MRKAKRTTKRAKRVISKYLKDVVEKRRENKRFNVCVGRVFKSEGGWSNHKADKGRKTMMGVTEATLFKALEDGIVKEPNIKLLTKEEAKKIYRHYYWDAFECGKYNPGMDYFRFDCSINHSPAGNRAIFRNTKNNLYAAYVNRYGYYNGIVRRDKTQRVFLNGWLKRCREVYETALSDRT